MKEKSFRYIIDSLVVLLNFCGARANALLFKLLGLESQRLVTILVILIDMVYLTYRFRGLFSSNLYKTKYLTPLIFAISILFLNSLNCLIEGKSLGTNFLFMVLIIMFALILKVLVSDYRYVPYERGVQLLSRGYIWIALISILGVFIAFTLIQVIGFSYVPFDADFLETHNERADVYHYWCYTSGVMQSLELRVPFFQDYGFLTGLYHEPHILAQNVFPALILLLGFFHNKTVKCVLILTGILIFLFSGSVTALLTITACLLLYFFLNVRINIWGTILGIMTIIAGLVFFIQYSDGTFIDFVISRMDDSGSMQYSQNALEFAFTPHTFFGSNIMAQNTYMDEMGGGIRTSDVGYIAFFLNIGFIISYIVNVVRLLFKKDTMANAVAFASLYYLLHSAKVGLAIFIQVMPVFLVFLQYMVLREYGRRKTVTTNSQNGAAIRVVQ